MGCKISKICTYKISNESEKTRELSKTFQTSVAQLNIATTIIDESPSTSTTLRWRWISGSLLYCMIQHLWVIRNIDGRQLSLYRLEDSSTIFVDTRSQQELPIISCTRTSDLIGLDHELLRRKISLKSVCPNNMHARIHFLTCRSDSRFWDIQWL